MVSPRHIRRCAAGAAVIALLATGPAGADITGSLDVAIELESGCVINGVNAADGSGGADFGTLDFGLQTTLFTTAEAQVSGGGAGIAIQCTAGASPVLVFQAGLHDGQGAGPGGRAMLHAGIAGQYVTYDLLRADNVTVLGDGDSIALADDGSAQTVTVNGRAYGAADLAAGVYSDVVIILLEL